MIQVWMIVISFHRFGDVRRPLDKGVPMGDSTTVQRDCVTFIAAASTNKKHLGEGRVNLSTDTVVERNGARTSEPEASLVVFPERKQRPGRRQVGGAMAQNSSKKYPQLNAYLSHQSIARYEQLRK